MPSPIVHLEIMFQLFSSLNRPVTPQLLLGAISPDAIHMRPNQTWHDKSVTHFYEEADISFTEAIEKAKTLINCESADLKLGYLIHLYTDYLWREHVYTPYFKMYKDQMLRSDLHALYYREMQRIDAVILKESSWLDEAILKLQQLQGLACLPLLSKEEIEAWRLKVLMHDLGENHLVDGEFEVFTLMEIKTFLRDCCEQLIHQFH